MNANTVNVDQAAIDAELAELAQDTAAPTVAPESPTDAASTGEAAGQSVDWSAVMQGSMQLLSRIVAPNWQLTDDEQHVLASQGAAVLDAFFPNFVLDEKWLLLGVFTISAGGIAMQRYDEDTEAFRPLRLQRAKKEPEPESVQTVSGRAVSESSRNDESRHRPAAVEPSGKSVAAAPYARVPG